MYRISRARVCRVSGKIAKDYQVYILILPALIYYIVFHYLPMYGVQMAFMDFNPVRGFSGSTWVGLENFKRLIFGPYFLNILRNTLFLSFYSLIVAFPFPVIFALIINTIPENIFRRSVQTITYAPHFISIVVLVGIIKLFTLPSYGVVNHFIEYIGGQTINFMQKSEWFAHLYVWSGIWQNTGWSSIIYIAALSGINPELHEAAVVDGASKLRRIWHIDLPGIVPTIIIILILNAGRILNVGFEKAFLMQNPVNEGVSEVISTYSYKVGIEQAQYSFSSAVSLFNSFVNMIMLILVNHMSKKFSETSLF